MDTDPSSSELYNTLFDRMKAALLTPVAHFGTQHMNLIELAEHTLESDEEIADAIVQQVLNAIWPEYENLLKWVEAVEVDSATKQDEAFARGLEIPEHLLRRSQERTRSYGRPATEAEWRLREEFAKVLDREHRSHSQTANGCIAAVIKAGWKLIHAETGQTIE